MSERSAVVLSQVAERAAVLPTANVVRFLCKLVADVYSDNFAGHTTGRQYALAVDINTRRVILGHRLSPPDRASMHESHQAMATIEFPTVEEFLRTNPAKFKDMRAAGETYFGELDNWKDNPTGDTALDVADSLRHYAGEICRIVDQSQPARPAYSLNWGITGAVIGEAAGAVADQVVAQIFPSKSPALGLTLVAVGGVVGFGVAEAIGRGANSLADAHRSRARSWDVNGASQPAGNYNETSNTSDRAGG